MAKSITMPEANVGAVRYTIAKTGNSSTLNGALDDSQTTITLVDASTLGASGKVKIEAEVISYAAKDGNDLTGCVRGIEEGLPVEHADTTAVDEVTTSYTTISSLDVVDYFADTADVGDALYFTRNKIWYDPGFTAVKFYVGTALVANSITITWEYFQRTTLVWKAFEVVIDDTENLTVLGENWVHFMVPWDWRETVVEGYSSGNVCWCRARITAVDSLTEGGAQSTQYLKCRYNVLSLSGGTDEDPITRTDIYDEFVAQGWPYMEKIHTDHSGGWSIYIVRGLIFSAAADNVCKILNCQLIFAPGYPKGGIWEFGAPKTGAAGDYLGDEGMTLTVGAFGFNRVIYWGGTLRFYNSALIMICSQDAGYGMSRNFTGSIAFGVGGAYTMYGGGTCEYRNSPLNLTFNTYTAPASFDWTFPSASINSIFAYYNSLGAMARDATWVSSLSLGHNTKVIVYDVNYGSLAAYTGAGAVGTIAQFIIHYSLSLTVVDSSGDPVVGATVSVLDQFGDRGKAWVGTLADGGLVDSEDLVTDDDGNVTLDLLHYWWYQERGQATITTTFSPFTVSIIGTAGLKSETAAYTMDRKREEIETLIAFEPENIDIVDGLAYNVTVTDE